MKKYSFLLIGCLLLTLGYFIRKYEFFIPYHYISLKTKNIFIDQRKKEKFYLKDITSKLNLNFNYMPPKISPVAYFRVDSLVQGPGAAVVDINSDGHQDIFVMSPRSEIQSHLYLSKNGKEFIESAKSFNLDQISNKNFYGLVPIFFDSDNDGDLDFYASGIGCARFFENKNGTFKEATTKSQLGDCQSSQAAIYFDYDQDGLLDLYVLRYWGDKDLIHGNDPFIYVNNLHNATNGGKNTLYKNMGNNIFKDVTDVVGGGDAHWSYDAAYADLDGDGNFEVYISNDYGPDVVYRIKDKKLIDISNIFNVPDRRYGMNVSLIDLGDKNPGVYISNQYVGYGWSLYGNFFWQMKDRSEIKDQAKGYNLYDCKMAWGAAHGDFNLDGLEDLYVANGFAPPRPHYQEENSNQKQNFSKLEEQKAFYYEWFLRALSGEVTKDIRKWSKLIRYGSRNDQQDCLFLNHDNEFFFNMSEELTDVKIWNGKSVVTIDRKNNGILDLLVTTNNGPIHYFENQLKNPTGSWIGFSLIGKESNRMAIGSMIMVKQNEKQFYRWNTGGRSGLLSTSDSRLHFGLPEKNKNVAVMVKWPNGKIKEYGNYSPGKYYKIYE